MALAYGTVVATPEGRRAIQQLEVRAAILASGEPLAWKPWTVKFSDGAPPGPSRSGGRTMVRLRWDDGEIIVTPDHVFVRSDLHLVQAQMLPPRSQLLGADGAPVTVQAVELGSFNVGVHGIGTNAPWPTAAFAGHLLNTQGVVTGDAFVEMNFGRDMPGALAGLPVIGSQEYGLQTPDGPLVER